MFDEHDYEVILGNKCHTCGNLESQIAESRISKFRVNSTIYCGTLCLYSRIVANFTLVCSRDYATSSDRSPGTGVRKIAKTARFGRWILVTESVHS
ncbi:hypothetical protein HN011_004407 [Eciton burchellii]|nr:hypothetical protein HN011_004407 [Eciton burchellii]